MVGNAQTIYEYIVNLFGTYSPYVNAQTGDFSIDFTYILAGAAFLVVLNYACKSVYTLLKALLGGGNYA